MRVFGATVLLLTGWLGAARLVDGGRVLAWMCLERCHNYTQQDVAAHLQQALYLHRAGILQSVSFEAFNLGPDSQLELNNLSSVHAALHAAGLATYPMVSSFPYPPQFLDW